MKFKVLLASLVLSFASVSSAEGEYDYVEYDFERWYAGARAVAVIPQGGGEMRNLCGAGAYLGYYLGDFITLEISAACLEDTVGLSVRHLWHWWGYEKFDPFFTFGASGWIDGEIGPTVGWGTFWHFNDYWSLRFDADATYGVDGADEMVYSVSLGIQCSF
ncbi:MAG: hypothetical protein J6W10_09005 [Kiritimatiellae bacterium]|nr:hypothetical protein [Kiritimatiellia bacterium]